MIRSVSSIFKFSKQLYYFIAASSVFLFFLLGSSFSNERQGIQKIRGTFFEDTLVKNFKNPPRQYSIFPFWSLNNTLDTAKMNWQVDQMIDKGVYGAFMHARDGLDQSETPYFSEGWWNAIESTVKYAHQKNFFTNLYDEDKWPSGSAGGRTIKANPERNIKKILRYTNFEVPGSQIIQLNFADHPMKIFAGKISDRGVYDFSSQQDLTSLSGKEWNVPPGRWAIIAFTLIKDPQRQINYMDSATVADFFHVTHDEYYKRLGSYFGNTIPGVFFDEIYANSSDRHNNIFWSDDFSEQFQKIKGYDLTFYLPLMIYDDPKFSSKARFDFFDVVKDLYSKAWFKQYADWASKHHIWVTGHTTEELIQYIRQSDYFYTEGQLQVPCTDNEDYRYGYPRQIDWYDPKQISSVAHIYGRKRVAAESMGSGGYAIPLEEYRNGFALLGVYGVNMFIPHLFHYSMDRPENQADWPPSWFYQNPYWKYFKPLANYAQRISYMLSQGQHVCKVGIVYPLTQIWLGGYTTPVDDSYYKEVQEQLLNNHIDYDIIDPSSLLRAGCDENGLHLEKENYKVIILPDLHAVESGVMKKLEEFTSKGGIIIGLKELPSGSESNSSADPSIINSVTNLFGFQPAALKQEQYYDIDKNGIHNYTENNYQKGKAVFTRYLEELPSIINESVGADIDVNGPDKIWLKFQHRKVDSRNVFFFVNAKQDNISCKVSFQDMGKPYLWDPETGEIKEITNYRVNNGRLELLLNFKPSGSFFIVLEPGSVQGNDVLIKKTDIEDMTLTKTGDEFTISGWSSGKSEHQAEIWKGNNLFVKKWSSSSSLPEIQIDNKWTFQVCPNALNYKWSDDIKDDTLAIPVMQFKADFSDEWKMIKVEDQFSKEKACQRYLTSWDGSWINYYDYSRHLPDITGGTKYFKKEIIVNGEIKNASVDITADKSYELFINDKLVGKGSDWKTPGHYDISNILSAGSNLIFVKTTATHGLLINGTYSLKNGSAFSFQTDSSWSASSDKINWNEAFDYAAPPLGSWGNIDRPGHSVRFPLTVSYQQLIPPGAKTILRPDIIGKYDIFINDHKVSFKKGETNIESLLTADKNILSIKVKVGNYNEGLQRPVRIICEKTTEPLRSWTDMGLSWYSGRAMYSHTLKLPKEYFEANQKLILDLGTVDYFAEIWINDQLVKYCSWSPFKAEISPYVHAGENKITIVVANLLANQASWNLMDANIDNKAARWWNYGSIMREKEKLTSGLIGPVKIIPFKKESVQFNVKDLN
ncbi:MAG TPA: glycosyl hydrolase [Chitinophagaceae bacterium]|nr:glycosyl hydrolase [Chitinophagaceae bacterium]